MRKSPGKWIRHLLGKKSSKSNLSKGRVKNPATKEEVLVSPEVTESFVDPPPTSSLIPASGLLQQNDVHAGVPPESQDDGVASQSENANSNTVVIAPSQEPDTLDVQQLEELAAARVQAVFRGYLARRAFQTLKGIVRLQAVIRGHLVRRQGIATLYCAWGIIKFQALTRGQKIRRSDIGIEVLKIRENRLQASKGYDAVTVTTSTGVKNSSNNALIQKLLVPSHKVLPLRLQYVHGEPNSNWEWLSRWMSSRFWESPSQQSRKVPSKSHTYGSSQKIRNEDNAKRSLRKVSGANVENGSSHSTSDEKPKRNPRKLSNGSVMEDSQPVVEKTKRGIKSSDLKKEVSDRIEAGFEKPKQKLKNIAVSAHASEVLELKSPKTVTNMTEPLPKPSNLGASQTLSIADDSINNHDPSSEHVKDNGLYENGQRTEKELSAKNADISNENLKVSQRRSSLPVKIDQDENVLQKTPRVPSYMAPTESAKAKLRGQSSPRLAHDIIEKNGMTRRHSLPSSTTASFSSQSPRAQKLVQSAGKGGFRSDKSLTSSRDAIDKGVKADWRR